MAKAAYEKGDYTTAVNSSLRLLELSGHPFSQASMSTRSEVCIVLFKSGHEEHADNAMHSFLSLSKTASQEIYDFFVEMFLVYAVGCETAGKAATMAEQLLERKPDHVPALTIQMKVLAESNKLAEAQAVARKITALTKDEKLVAYRQEALRILGIEEKRKVTPPDSATSP